MAESFRVVDIIQKKKAGLPLSSEEISFIVQGYTEGHIPDYQVAAWLMAICWQGMDERETTDLALAMACSGETLDLHHIAPITVDKHSTGGVGDKTSLVLAPMVASCGLTVAKMSGRGLGFSGGTVDKLESIPGFQGEMPRAQFEQAARRVGLVITAQSVELAPADKKLYALRDVTGTVDSLPLIASSIMSKKLAAGSDCIVLDVKVGRGAFIATLADARTLASTMLRIGQLAGKKVRAIISNMDQPLGYAVGNALELHEAILALRGEGPDDLTELCLQLGSLLLQMAGTCTDANQARLQLTDQLKTGAAWDKFRAFIANQGGDVGVVDHPQLLPKAALVEPLLSPYDGYVSSLDAREVAQATIALGAGRSTKDASIDYAVGVVLQAKTGHPVRKGQPLLTIHANDPDRLAEARRILSQAFEFSQQPVPPPPVVLEVL